MPPGFWKSSFFSSNTHRTYLVWDKEDGGTGKTTVELREQTRIPVVVSPTPYSKVARET
jgi:hypothetical protein